MILFERKIFKSLKHEQIFKKKTFELKFQKKESFIQQNHFGKLDFPKFYHDFLIKNCFFHY